MEIKNSSGKVIGTVTKTENGFLIVNQPKPDLLINDTNLIEKIEEAINGEDVSFSKFVISNSAHSFGSKNFRCKYFLSFEHLYFCLSDALSHLTKIAKHANGIADDTNLRAAVIDHTDRKLTNGHSHFDRPKNRLKIEGKSVYLTP